MLSGFLACSFKAGPAVHCSISVIMLPGYRIVAMQVMGGPNILTGATDAHSKAVRKGVAPAFSASRMRDACKVSESAGYRIC